MNRRPSSPRRSTRRAATPPKLSSFLLLLVVLVAVWAYEGGYFDRWLGQVSESIPQAAQAPEQEDGEQAVPAPTVAEVVPQPSTAPIPTPPVQQSIDTRNLRGYSGGWYQVYFTKPSYPEKSANRVEGADETIAADIANARRRIEVASFDFDLPVVTQALVDAQKRGVQVRVSVDGENLEDADVAKLTGDLQAAGIPVFFDERQAFMHNKFIVIDDATVWTGSMNLTINDVFRNNNNMLRIVDPNLAANYLAKAEDIFTGKGGTDGGSVLVNPRLTIGGASVQTMFAPDDPITDAVVERINGAQQRVDVLAFAFTSDPIANALVSARERGLAVRGVMESRNAKGTGSDLEKVRAAGIDFQTDGNCYIMHHKVIVIDGRTVITGSFNWTRGAQEQNDENVLIIDDPTLAARYLEEVDRVYQQALNPTRCN